MDTNIYKSKFLESTDKRNNYDFFSCNHNDIHLGKFFVHLFGEYYSRVMIPNWYFNEELLKRIISHFSLPESQIIRRTTLVRNDFQQTNYNQSEYYLILKDSLMLKIHHIQVDILYGAEIIESEINEIINIVNEYKRPVTDKKKFFMIHNTNGSFNLTDFAINESEVDIDTHYNNDFNVIHGDILKALESKNKNGLILLHGKFGTGKTHYLRHLISNINRRFIYFPINMVDSLSSPDFLPFISHQKDSVLILEDCEKLLINRESGLGNSSSLATLLNIGDGLLADALSINVICTFNLSSKKIDDALLRKGRMLARYEFNELEIIKAQNLANKIGKQIQVDRPMTVSEIYNFNERNFANKPLKSIGFNTSN